MSIKLYTLFIKLLWSYPLENDDIMRIFGYMTKSAIKDSCYIIHSFYNS